MPHCSQFVKEESPTAQEKRKKREKQKRGRGRKQRIEKETEEESELLISGVSGKSECFI